MKRFILLAIASGIAMTACSTQRFGSELEARIAADKYIEKVGTYTEWYKKIEQIYPNPVTCKNSMYDATCYKKKVKYNYKKVDRIRQTNIIECTHEKSTWQFVCFDSRDNSNYRYFKY